MFDDSPVTPTCRWPAKVKACWWSMLAAAGSSRMPGSRLPHRITPAAGSLKVRRRGRSVTLYRARSSDVWELFEAHLDHNHITGTVGFATAPAVAAACPTPIADHRFASSPHPTSAPLRRTELAKSSSIYGSGFHHSHQIRHPNPAPLSARARGRRRWRGSCPGSRRSSRPP